MEELYYKYDHENINLDKELLSNRITEYSNLEIDAIVYIVA